METNAILQADILDIIFEKKNKVYGAYELRKHYNRRLLKALCCATMFIAIAYSLTFIKTKKIKTIEVSGGIILAKAPVFPEKKPDPVKSTVKPSVPKETMVKQKISTQQYITNIKIEKVEPEIAPIETLNDKSILSNSTTKGDVQEAKTNTINTGDAKENAVAKQVSIDHVTPELSAEVMPAYPGGMDALRKFLEQNLQNPQDLDEGQVVSVKINFIVGYDGVLKGFKVVEDGGEAFNNEVIRVLKKMPKWIPGKTHGENVSVFYTIPVKFVAN